MFTIYAEQRRAEDGEPYLRRAITIAEKQFPGTAAMAHLQVCLGALEFSRGHFEEAKRILRDAMTLQERTLGPSHPEVGRSLLDYSAVMSRLHHKTEARQALTRAWLTLNRNSASQ